MSEADAVAGVLLVGATMYAVFGGADFGAGVWSLLAGRGDRGRRPRALIDWAIGPVWEANHVWLIFTLSLGIVAPSEETPSVQVILLYCSISLKVGLKSLSSEDFSLF